MIEQLFSQPLFWLTATLGAYLFGLTIYKSFNNPSWLPPVLTGFLLMIFLLEVTGTTFETYSQGGQFLSIFLGPVVVALAVPLYQQIHTMKGQALRILLAIIIGSATTVAVAVALTYYFIGDDLIAKTMATKSVTTPIAVAISEEIDAITALAATFVMVTGIIGSVITPAILRALKLDNPQAMGVSLGVCSHAVGTSRAIELGQTETAYAAMAMTLTGGIHAFLLPLLLS